MSISDDDYSISDDEHLNTNDDLNDSDLDFYDDSIIPERSESDFSTMSTLDFDDLDSDSESSSDQGIPVLLAF